MDDPRPGEVYKILVPGVAYRSPTPGVWAVNLGFPDDDDFGDMTMHVGTSELLPVDATTRSVTLHRPLEDFAKWIVRLDDVTGPGSEERRTVTLTSIIRKAKEALAPPKE